MESKRTRQGGAGKRLARRTAGACWLGATIYYIFLLNWPIRWRNSAYNTLNVFPEILWGQPELHFNSRAFGQRLRTPIISPIILRAFSIRVPCAGAGRIFSCPSHYGRARTSQAA